MIKIKPIIRKEETPDQLVDVIDGVEVMDGEEITLVDNVAVVVRAYSNLADAKAHDGVIVDEDFDTTAFLTARAEAKTISETQAAIDNAQDKVTKRLASTMDALLGFIASVHTLTESQQVFVDDFRNDYAAWKALEE